MAIFIYNGVFFMHKNKALSDSAVYTNFWLAARVNIVDDSVFKFTGGNYEYLYLTSSLDFKNRRVLMEIAIKT